MKSIFKFAVLAAAVTLSVFTACQKQGETAVVAGDKTQLNVAIAEAETLLKVATPALYPQTAIDDLQKTLTAVKSASSGTIDQTTCDNLTAQLNAAITTFKSQAYGKIDDKNLVFELKFDEGTGTSLKTTGQYKWTANFAKGPKAVFADTVGTPAFVDGVKGKALSFKNGAHLEIADYDENALIPQQFSISVWVKPTKTYANNYILSYNQWDTWKYQLQDHDKPFLTTHSESGYCDHDCAVDGSCPPGAWTHTVASINLATGHMKFYINGQLTKDWEGCGSGSFVIPEKPFGVFIVGAQSLETIDDPEGKTPDNWSCFYGALDELKFYNIELTEGQVALIYATEK